MKKLLKLTLLSTLAVAISAQAELVGGQSKKANNNYIAVGSTNFTTNPDDNGAGHFGKNGSPGIMVHKMSPKTNKRKFVSLLGLKLVSKTDFKGITHIDKNSWGVPKKHKNKIGTLDFSRVNAWGGNQVYFGEWSQTGKKNAKDRQVWYVGDNKTTDMPNGGKVKYKVKGIRQYQHKGLLTGILTADFSSKKLTGKLGDIEFGNSVKINTKKASFAGGVSVGKTNGKTTGHFFGKKAAEIGGIATFDKNRNLDTAFGGKKK